MALNANTLGQALYNAREPFNNTPWETLLQTYGSEAGIRLAAANADADAIVAHITGNAEVPALGLVAPNGNVTGEAKII